MSDMPSMQNQSADDDYDDTLIVPPPNLKERVQAAQRARKTGEIRQSVEIPNPLTKSGDEPLSDASSGTENQIIQPQA